MSSAMGPMSTDILPLAHTHLYACLLLKSALATTIMPINMITAKTEATARLGVPSVRETNAEPRKSTPQRA